MSTHLKRKYLLVFLIFVFLKANSQNCPLASEYHKYNTGWVVGDTIEYSFYNNRKDTIERKIFKPGNGIIFRYSALYDCPEIFDEERNDMVTWSIPDTSTVFSITLSTNNFKNAAFAYTLGQFGYSRSKQLLSVSGNIQGKKEGDNWNIAASLNLTAGNLGSQQIINRTVTFSKIFVQTKYTGPKRKLKYAENYPFFY